MERFELRSRYFAYDVVVGRGAWRALSLYPRDRYSSTFVLTERPLWRRWGERFTAEARLGEPRPIFIARGERSKSLAAVERVAGELLARGADRRSLLVLFGGGVVGDLGGFTASAYMRGIDYVQVPTTLLAQVDSSIGGKTAVNVRAMKNLVGAFHPPRLVVSEPAVLGSLPPRAFRSGLYEVVKHAILAGEPLFSRLESSIGSLSASATRALEPIVSAAAQVKIDVVNRDEREASVRYVLNLGHTFGHALEETTNYERFAHGEAVGWGLLIVTRLAERLGFLRCRGKGGTQAGNSEAERIRRLVRAVGPLPSIRDLSAEKLMALLPQDKKAVAGRIHWVIPQAIGKVRITTDVDPKEAAAAFREVQSGG